VRYAWDIRAICPVGDPGQLRLVAPAYDCATGAITFQTQGGEGTPIEYAAAGITDWTSNPNQFVDYEHRHAADAQPITLLARQLTSNGAYIYDSYVWDIRAICPVSTASARRAAAEPGLTFQISVSPNPVGEEFRVKIEGAQHQSVRFQLTDLSGQVLVDKQMLVEQALHQEQLRLGASPAGMYLLRVSTATQSQTVRLLKAE